MGKQRVWMHWEWMAVCRYPFMAGSTVGKNSGLLLGIFLRYKQPNAINAPQQYVQQQNTHTQELQHVNCCRCLSCLGRHCRLGKLHVRGWGATTKHEQKNHLSGAAGTELFRHHFKLSHGSKSGPDDERACSKADECVEESMKMHRAQQPRAVWLKGSVRKRLGLH